MKRWREPRRMKAHAPSPPACGRGGGSLQRLPANHAIIPLTQGAVTFVDAEDVEWISARRWLLAYRGGYAARKLSKAENPTGSRRLLFLHNAIMKPPVGFVVDHADGDRLNNTRSNLRVCSLAANAANRVLPVGRSGFKGVYAEGARWAAKIRINYRLVRLGMFDDPALAAQAYDRAASTANPGFAVLNFPRAGFRSLHGDSNSAAVMTVSGNSQKVFP